ncbi:TPA: hypothetical protein ACQO4Q_001833, partial [Streptococcus pyogenes]
SLIRNICQFRNVTKPTKGENMPEDLIKQLEAGSEFLAKTCLHSKIIITVDGVRLVETKEFHPVSGTLLD